jgi:hypothetical protein
MPDILRTQKLAVHFFSAVECTGLNVSLIAVPKGHMSLFDAFAATCCAMKLEVNTCSKFRMPEGAAGLVRACITWLLEEDNIQLSMDVETFGGGLFVDEETTMLNEFCEAVTVVEPSVAMSLGRGTSTAQRLLMYKRQILGLKTGDGLEIYGFAEKFFPRLNNLYTQVLCELYCSTITVIDFERRCYKTYTSHQNNVSQQRHVILFKVDWFGCDYYYGLIDNDKTMK